VLDAILAENRSMQKYHMSLKWVPNQNFNLRQIWYMYVDELKHQPQRTMAILLMPDHLHLLTQTPEPLRIEKLIYKVTREHGGSWSEPVWSCDIRGPAQLLQVYKYIYCNPVRSGFVRKVEEYPFSSLQFLLGKEKSPLVIHDPLNFITDPIRILTWLNTPELFSPFYSTRAFGT
jgi:REP element-mobilizing transposase RayT